MERKKFILKTTFNNYWLRVCQERDDVDRGLASVSTNIVSLMIYQIMSAWINLFKSHVWMHYS